MIADARAAHAAAQDAAAEARETLIAELDAATARLERAPDQDERWA